MSGPPAPIQVLYVDDDPDVADSVTASLERADDGLSVATEPSAEAGLAHLAEQDVDCVVSAYGLPDATGIEFLASVREERPELPFVIVTGQGSEAIASEAIAAGVTDYVVWDAGDESDALLADRVLDAVEGHHSGRSPSSHVDSHQELERARDLLAQTERLADVGGWEIDTETMEVFWTEHLFELTGVEGGEPALEEAIEVYHEDDRPIIEEAVERALAEGEPFDEEVRYRGPAGEVRWLRVRGDPAVEDGEVVTLRGAVQDVTERRNRERVLREMYEIVADTDSSFDEQVRSLLELGRAELGTAYGTLSEIRGEDYVFDVVAADDDGIQEGEVVPVEATNCEIAASTRETLVLGDVERDAPGETDRAGFTEWGIACYIGTPVFVDGAVRGTFCFYDTEPRVDQFGDWEVTLVDLMARLVSTELERLRTNDQLREQNERLESFVSIVSHDLRNPLNVASGRLALAREERDDEQLQAVADAHDRMEELIEDLLQLAREGERATNLAPEDLGVLAKACWQNVEVADGSLALADPPSIRADRGRLQQLLENLVRNAVEHGGATVTVTIGALDDGFYVEDDGPGIPADDREAVLEAGYTTHEEGTGFGLNIVAQIADAHGWDLRLAEGTTDGARFEFTDVDLVA